MPFEALLSAYLRFLFRFLDGACSMVANTSSRQDKYVLNVTWRRLAEIINQRKELGSAMQFGGDTW